MYSNGIKWYYRLVEIPEFDGQKKSRALLQDISRTEGHLIVCMEVPAQPKNYHMFADFPSYVSFFKHQFGFLPERRCFFEVISGDDPQKSHFDVDLHREKLPEGMTLDSAFESIKDDLLIAIIEGYMTMGIKLNPEKDILIFTSHGENKRSMHVIITNYCHTDNKEAEEFYRLVMNIIKNPLINDEIVDKAVYKDNQQFRLVGSQKYGSSRPKTFNEEFCIKGTKYKHILPEEPLDDHHKSYLIFEESLVGSWFTCIFFPQLAKNKVKHNFEVPEDIDAKTAKDAIELYGKFVGVSSNSRNFPYKLSGVRGNIVILQRISSSVCPICDRRHDTENPYLLVNNGSVIFCCRRNEGKRLFVGHLANQTATNTCIGSETKDPDEINDGIEPGFHFGPIVVPEKEIKIAFNPEISFSELASKVPPIPRKKFTATEIPIGFLNSLVK